MLRTTVAFVTVLMCMLCLAVPGNAVELEAGSVYCFGTGDFSLEETVTGICVTKVPEKSLGALRLGSRTIRSGDILTAGQTEQLTFSTPLGRADRTAEISYLPIYENRVAPCTAMTIHIRGKEDHAPIAENSAAETYRNMSATGSLKVSDPEGQPMTFAVTRQPRRGTVTIHEDGTFTYTPKKNKVGVDSFTYTATDPAGNVSREATVTVTVLKPTDAPSYTDTASFTAEWMKHTGIFTGETLGNQSCFQPEKPVTRGEFVTMLVNALDMPVEETLTQTGYTDEIPRWLQPYLAAAVRSGLTSGLESSETFGCYDPITAAEAAAMISNLTEPDMISQEASHILTREEVSQILYQCVAQTTGTAKF